MKLALRHGHALTGTPNALRRCGRVRRDLNRRAHERRLDAGAHDRGTALVAQVSRSGRQAQLRRFLRACGSSPSPTRKLTRSVLCSAPPARQTSLTPTRS